MLSEVLLDPFGSLDDVKDFDEVVMGEKNYPQLENHLQREGWMNDNGKSLGSSL